MAIRILPNNIAIIDGDQAISKWVEDGGLIHDKTTSNVIRAIIKKHKVTHCVDLGANIGSLTRVMLNAGCAVTAFEADGLLHQCLLHNCPELVNDGSDRF